MPRPLSETEIPADALAALKRGNKIEAIKLMRQSTGLGLKESKDAVEARLRADAALREAFQTAARDSATGSLPLLVFVIVVSVLLYWFVFRNQ